MPSYHASISRPRRRSIALAAVGIAGALSLTLAGCGGSADGTSGGSGSTQVGYSAPFLSAQFEVVLQDTVLQQAKDSSLDFLSPTNADSDSGQQITDVANLISAGAKGLIVVANDSKAIIPALDQAKSANVPVVAIDIGPDGGHVAAIVRADNVGMGEMACKAMADAIGGEGKVLSLMGAETSINGRERSQGFHDCITQNYPNITLIERPTDWDPTKQANALQTVLAANPDLKGVFQQSDYALSPTLNVLKTAGRDAKVGEDGHIFDISIDGTPQALDLVRQGVLDAAISQPLGGYAKYGLQYLQDALAGKEIPLGPTDHDSKVVEFNGNPMDLLPAVLVTKDNVDDSSLWGNQADQ
ncbi:MAG: sugar ABC transporter substrate-binding protein [Nocardioides sp.]|uniref:sugar ABC transporter substrate-binding protein n=1 Tax=Nocardioides sp. TaxID=35761 RepID=UPI0039E60FF1